MEQKRDLHLCKVAEWEWHSERRKRSEKKDVSHYVCVWNILCMGALLKDL